MAKESYIYYSKCGAFNYNYQDRATSPNVPPHMHDCYEIYLFLEGDAVYSVEGNIYELSHNDILFTNSRELHSPVFKSNAKYTRALVFLKLNFLSEFITKDYNPFQGIEQRKLGQQNKIDSKFVEKYGLDEKFRNIDYYTRNALPQSELMIKTNIVQIIATIDSILSISDKKFHRYNKVQNIIEYINENLFQDISLDKLEEEFHLNKFHLSHSFKDQTGYSIGKFIAQKRVLAAKDLLINNIPVQEIADMVGFNDYSNFYKTFRNITGVSPKNFTKIL